MGPQVIRTSFDRDIVSKTWIYSSLAIRARWVTFLEPLVQVIHLQDENTGRLQGCLLCISGDGTIVVIVIDSFELWVPLLCKNSYLTQASSLYLIPGSPAKLVKLCLSGDSLMLLYADGRARLWDSKTREFRRSMSSEKASEHLNQNEWISL